MYNALFPKLMAVVVGAWVLGSRFNLFSGCLEGFQLFDLINRIAPPWMSYRFFQMALITLATQVVVHILSYLAFRRSPANAILRNGC